MSKLVEDFKAKMSDTEDYVKKDTDLEINKKMNEKIIMEYTEPNFNIVEVDGVKKIVQDFQYMSEFTKRIADKNVATKKDAAVPSLDEEVMGIKK